MKINTIEETFREAKRAGCPLLQISTSDPAKTILATLAALNGKSQDFAVCEHDIIRGLRGINDRGRELQQQFIIRGTNNQGRELQQQEDALATANAIEFLAKLQDKCLGESASAARNALIYFHNAHKWMDSPQGIQALWNLRDTLKSSNVQGTLVLLTAGLSVPAELKQDVITLEDPLPSPDAIRAVVRNICTIAAKSGATFDVETVCADDKIVDTLSGTSAFGAEQVLSMAVRTAGIDMGVLGERKRRLVQQTAGLSIWQGNESFETLGGLDNLKGFLRNILTSGRTPVRAIGFIDEIEKAMAAAGTDTSGTTQDQNAALLRVMQDYNIPGIILLGPPGTGKSEIAKAAGGVAGAPVVAFDLGAAKGSLVGESEQRIRSMLDVFLGISQGKALLIATCNGIKALPPELRRRFRLGTFFVDLPGKEERDLIWAIWCKKLGLETQTLPACNGWSGAEIAACCDVAYRTGTSLLEAAKFVVPLAVSAGDKIEELRKAASNRYLAASYAGLYQYRAEPASVPASNDRAFQLGD